MTPYVHGDNEQSRKNFITELFTVPEALHAIDVLPAPGRAEFLVEGPDRQRTAVSIDPIGFGDPVDWAPPWDRADVQAPRYLRRASEPFWYEHDEARDLLFVQVNQVRDGRQSYRDFFAGVVDTAGELEPEKVVLDLRHNGGGNKRLNSAPLQMLADSPAINRAGSFYVIVGRGTFSAATHLAVQLELSTAATLVGEPTGGRPTHYGDAESFDLPHGDLRITASSRYWEDGGPDYDRPAVMPRLHAPPSAAAYFAGRDPALEAILAAR